MAHATNQKTATAESGRVSCQALYKSFGSTKAVDGVSLDLAPGKTLSIVGPSGCGKTTLLRLLAGFESPDQGEVALGGQVVAGPGAWTPPEARHVGMVFQDYALFPHMTVAQNVEFGLIGWDKADREARMREMLQLVRLEGMGQRRPHQLSGGEQQRVALARSLAPRPMALFMDEPFSNLDASLRLELREGVNAIISQLAITTIYVTHDQEQALFMGDEVAVMRRGRIQQRGAPEEVFHRPASPFVASFMGMSDFLPAVVVEGGLSAEGWLLPGKCDFPIGSRVQVLIRPDQVTMEPCPEGVEGSGVVVSRAFRGLDYLYSLALPSGTCLHSLQHHGVYYPIGESVRVSIKLNDSPICFEADAS